MRLASTVWVHGGGGGAVTVGLRNRTLQMQLKPSESLFVSFYLQRQALAQRRFKATTLLPCVFENKNIICQRGSPVSLATYHFKLYIAPVYLLDFLNLISSHLSTLLFLSMFSFL